MIRSAATSFPPLAWDVYRYLPSPIRDRIVRYRHAGIWDCVPDDCPALLVHIPKCGGTTIARKLYGAGWNHYPWWIWKAANPARYRDITTFTVLREPVERFLSAIRHCLGAPEASPAELAAGEILRTFGGLDQICEAYLNDASLRSRLRRIVHFKSQSFWIAKARCSQVDVVFALRNSQRRNLVQGSNINRAVATTRLPMRLRSSIERYYADDLEMYRAVAPHRQVCDVNEVFDSLLS